MPYNFVADSYQTNKLCSRLSPNEVQSYTENGRILCFRVPKEGLKGSVQ